MVTKQHRTWVKFTGSAHRAHCHDCRNWSGGNQTMMTDMARGMSMATAWQRSKMRAEQDAREHRSREEMKERRQQHEDRDR